MPRSSRLLVALAAVMLLAVYAFPLWRIGLVAPQYPEGLGMRIHVNDVRGETEHDLKNINGLNHYIGMKAIEPDAIPELRFMPWIVAGLIAGAVTVAALGKPKPLYIYLALFGITAVAGLVDFWLWQYDYGHNLDEAAAIIRIPGMSYQPPLIGTKQLLNFTATSWPDVGGIAIGLATGLVALAAFLAFRASRAVRRSGAIAAVALGTIACASTEPRDIHFGVEECAYCRMVVSDERYAGQLVSRTGKVFVFDSVECLAGYVLEHHVDDPPRSMWVTDFAHPGTLVEAEDARYVRGGPQRSPMGLGLVAFAPGWDPAQLALAHGGEQVDWTAVLGIVKLEEKRREAHRRVPQPA